MICGNLVEENEEFCNYHPKTPPIRYMYVLRMDGSQKTFRVLKIPVLAYDKEVVNVKPCEGSEYMEMIPVKDMESLGIGNTPQEAHNLAVKNTIRKAKDAIQQAQEANDVLDILSRARFVIPKQHSSTLF